MSVPTKRTLYNTQPGKAVYTTLTILFNAARLPLWLVYYIPQGLRPDPRWSWRQAVRMRIAKAFIGWIVTAELQTPFDLTPNVEKDQWVNLNPADSKYYTGITVVDPKVKPVKIGGTWYPSIPGTAAQAGKVALHFHGGAYMIGDGRKKDTEFLAKTLLRNGNVSHVFCAQYRLSSNPGGSFPAALQDAITSYSYLVNDLGISPSDIVVGGDSAGGNLTLSLLRYLADHGSDLGLENPKCAWLWSPWVDPQGSITAQETFHLHPNAPTDYLHRDFGAWGATCYAPNKSTGLDNNHEYINFRVNPFHTEVPLYFSGCEKEVLIDDIKASFDAFTKVKGNRTELSIEAASPHDIVLTGAIVGFEKEAAESVRKGAKFLAKL